MLGPASSFLSVHFFCVSLYFLITLFPVHPYAVKPCYALCIEHHAAGVRVFSFASDI